MTSNRPTIGSFTWYQAAHDLLMFTCWNHDNTSLGVHSISPDDLTRNIDALEAMGYINRTIRKEYLDFRTRTWMPEN